jgi:hypothetical protein
VNQEALIKAIESQVSAIELLVTKGDPEKMKEIAELRKKAAAAGPTGPGSLFGAGGIFSTAGIEGDVLTAHIRPLAGLVRLLQRFPSVLEQPRFATITGVTAESGSNPSNPCDDAPSGFLKGCNLTAQFGRIPKDTQTIEFDRVMRQLHGGINTDLSLRGMLLGMGDLNPAGLSEADVLNIYTMSEMVTAAILAERTLSTMVWQGSPANNVGSGYMEFPGLDNQIATGQVDADTNQACPAMDSDVKDFTYNNVAGNNPSIHNYLSQLEWYVRWNADRMGLEPAAFVVAMRQDLWFVLSEIWPCQYNTNRCANAAVNAAGNSLLTIDGNVNRATTDQMRQSMTIDINGRNYPVVTDTGIFEHNNINNANLAAGQYASPIYFIPLTIVGGFPVTYLEHVDYRRGAQDVNLLRGTETFWTDRGLYSWAAEFQKWCYKLTLKIEPRIVLRTPQLAGRIDNVMYDPLQHLRDPDPDSPYHFDGGVSLRPTPSTYAVWR